MRVLKVVGTIRTGVTRHAVLLTQRLSYTIRVDLRHNDLILGMCERVRQLLVDRCEVLWTEASARKHRSARTRRYMPCSDRTMAQSWERRGEPFTTHQEKV